MEIVLLMESMNLQNLRKEENELSKKNNRILERLNVVRSSIKVLEEEERNKKQYKLFK